MNEKTKQKTTILFSVPGFGLSTAWQGNAIAAAKPATFLNLWENYQHYTLSSPFEKPMSAASANAVPYTMIANGKQFVSNRVLVDKAISHQLLDHSEMLKSFFANIKKHNASLHLLGQISHQGENGDRDQLLRIIKVAKKNFLERIFIHIIVDNSYKNTNLLKNDLEHLEKEIEKLDAGEIVSVVGQNNILSNKKGQLPIEIYFEGKAKHYLSIEQGLAKQKNIKPVDLAPFIVSESRTAINDFDGIMLFSHTFDELSPIVPFFLANLKIISFAKKPKFTSIISLFDFPTIYHDHVPAVFRRRSDNTVAAKLSAAKKKQLLICDIAQKPELLHYYFGQNDGAEILLVPNKGTENDHINFTDKYIKELQKAVIANDFDLITVDFPFLAEIAANGYFDKATEIVGLVDKLLTSMVELQFEHNLDIIFISPFGSAEKILTYSPHDDKRPLARSENPLPLIYICEKTKQKSKSMNLIVDEIAGKKHDLTLVNQILCDSLGL